MALPSPGRLSRLLGVGLGIVVVVEVVVLTGPAVVVVLLLVLVWVVPVDVPERLPVVALSTHSIALPSAPLAPLYKLPRMGMLSILSLSHDSLLATHSSAVLAAFLTLLNAPEKPCQSGC